MPYERLIQTTPATAAAARHDRQLMPYMATTIHITAAWSYAMHYANQYEVVFEGRASSAHFSDAEDLLASVAASVLPTFDKSTGASETPGGRAIDEKGRVGCSPVCRSVARFQRSRDLPTKAEHWTDVPFIKATQ